MEFTQAGSFGYIIFSKEKPRYYAGNREAIKISPYEARSQIENNRIMAGLTVSGIGVATVLAGLAPSLMTQERTEKRREAVQESFPPIRVRLFQDTYLRGEHLVCDFATCWHDLFELRQLSSESPSQCTVISWQEEGRGSDRRQERVLLWKNSD
jgi:hypothetical protein